MSQTEKKQNNSNFTNGVILGGLLAGAGLYFLGTKNGRKNMHKILDACENLDKIVADQEKKLKNKKEGSTSVVSDVENLINKLQAVLPERKK